MNDELKRFLAEANDVTLTPEEKSATRVMLRIATGVDPAEASDPAIVRFFAEANGVQLTADEKSDAREAVSAMMGDVFVRTAEDDRHVLEMENLLTSMGASAEHSLDRRERADMRASLMKFVRGDADKPVDFDPAPGFSSMLFDFIRGIVPRTLTLACLFLLVGAGAAAAAESSVPGHWLYPFKVNVVENVRTKLAFTPEQKARWEAEKAMRRLREVESMAAGSELTGDAWTGLQGNFAKHVVEAQKRIAELSSTDTDAARRLSVDLNHRLEAHESVLETIGAERRDNADIEKVLENVKAVQTDLKAHETPIEELTPTEAARVADHTQENARLAITAASEMIDGIASKRGYDARSSARAKLLDARALLHEADAQYGAGLYDEALALARTAQKAARETELLLLLPVSRSSSSSTTSSEEMHGAASSAHSSTEESVSSASSIAEESPDDSNVQDVVDDALDGLDL